MLRRKEWKGELLIHWNSNETISLKVSIDQINDTLHNWLMSTMLFLPAERWLAGLLSLWLVLCKFKSLVTRVINQLRMDFNRKMEISELKNMNTSVEGFFFSSEDQSMEESQETILVRKSLCNTHNWRKRGIEDNRSLSISSALFTYVGTLSVSASINT